MYFLIFILGGWSYALIEILYRGYTFKSMFFLGGLVMITFYILCPDLIKMNLLIASLIGAGIITFYEFLSGLILNLWLGRNIWDYSSLHGNILGQICPQFSFCWFLLCFAFFSMVKYIYRII